MLIPGWFQKQLRAEFGGRFTARWSNARSCVVLDEKVARGLDPPARIGEKLRRLERVSPDQAEELRTRLQNGTAPFVEIYPGNRAPCPKCSTLVRLSFESWEWAHCPGCAKDFKAIYAPLGWWLLEQLRFLDFERGGDERVLAQMDEANEAKQTSDLREDRRVLDAAIRDDFTRIMQIQSVGWRAPRIEPETSGATS